MVEDDRIEPTGADRMVIVVINVALRARGVWREHPEHRKVPWKSRERFFSNYRIEACDEVPSYEFASTG